MRKSIILKVMSVLAVVVMSLSATSGMTAKALKSEQPISEESTSAIMVISADVIVTKFREYNGLLQYRRWNETRGYWVDPYWITI